MAPADAIARHRELRRYLLDGERLVTAVHQHWAKVAEPVASAVARPASSPSGWTSVIPASVGHVADVAVVALVRSSWSGRAWRLLEWRHDWFVATDKRLILTYGF